MSKPTWHARAISSLVKARELHQHLTNALTYKQSRPNIVSLAQRASEYFLKAILYERNIRVLETHKVNTIADRWRGMLKDIWGELESLMPEYSWLFNHRNIADYAHTDVATTSRYPGINEPEFTDADVSRALRVEAELMRLAELVVTF